MGSWLITINMLSFATVALAGATVGFTTGVDLMSVKSLDLGTSVGASALAAGAAGYGGGVALPS